MRASDQFHVGIVVDDLDTTLAELSELFGYEWCDEIAVQTPVRLPTGDTVLDQRFRYSKNEPRLEVIESIPGTLWVPAAGSGVHHLGYWSDDVARDSAELERRGIGREAAGILPDGGAHWAYHRGPDGPRIELVSTDLQGPLGHYWATGAMPTA